MTNIVLLENKEGENIVVSGELEIRALRNMRITVDFTFAIKAEFLNKIALQKKHTNKIALQKNLDKNYYYN